MQILYVGNGNLKHRGARYYDVGRKLVNGFTRLGHNVYAFSDRDTARAESILGSRKLGVKQCNKAFLESCTQLQPDLILLGHADIISHESLAAARKMLPDVKIAQFNVDIVFLPHNVQMIQSKLDVVDSTFVTTGGAVLKRFSSSNGHACYMPNPIDPSVEWPRCFERDDQPHDVFWAMRAGKVIRKGDRRVEYPLFLQQSGKVKIDYHGMNGKAGLFGAAYYQRIAQAKMGLNISSVDTRDSDQRASDEELYLYSSDRLSHYMGSGLLTFATRDHKLEDLFDEDKELIFISSAEELLDKVLYYKQHDDARKQIARAGWEKSHQQFNATLVAQYILDITFENDLTHDYAWPTQRY